MSGAASPVNVLPPVPPSAPAATENKGYISADLNVLSRSAQVERYRSRGDVLPQVAENDLQMVKHQWDKRLAKAIQTEADRTNSWSLLWKVEALYESLDAQVDQTLFRLLRPDIPERSDRIGVPASSRLKEFAAALEVICDPQKDFVSHLQQDQPTVLVQSLQFTSPYLNRLMGLPFSRRKLIAESLYGGRDGRGLCAAFRSDMELALTQASAPKLRGLLVPRIRMEATTPSSGFPFSSAIERTVVDAAPDFMTKAILQTPSIGRARSVSTTSSLGTGTGETSLGTGTGETSTDTKVAVPPTLPPPPAQTTPAQTSAPSLPTSASLSALASFFSQLPPPAPAPVSPSAPAPTGPSVPGAAAASAVPSPAASAVAAIAPTLLNFAGVPPAAQALLSPLLTPANVERASNVLTPLISAELKAGPSASGSAISAMVSLLGPQSSSKQGGAGYQRIGGALSDTEFKDAIIQLVELWVLRRLASDRADEMFAQLSNWTKCDGRLNLPDQRPPIDGFNHLSAKVVEWLIWPFLSPAVFPISRQIMLYGPAGAGKTVTCQLTAFDLAKALRWSEIKALTPAAAANAANAKTSPNDYVIAYFVDALKLRSPDPELVGLRLRNYLNCLQYEVDRDRVRTKRRKMALFILDNIDTLVVSDDELRQQPRAERKASQIRSWVYKSSPDTAAARQGGIGPNTPSRTAGNGGQQTIVISAGPGITVTSGSAGLLGKPSRSMSDVLASLLSPDALRAEYPDVRLIWSARYVWKLPPVLQSYVRPRQLFVDLPAKRARRSFLESMLRDDLYTNLADRLLEEVRLRGIRDMLSNERINLRAPSAQATFLDAKVAYITSYLEPYSDRKPSEPDESLYRAEMRLKDELRTEFTRKYREFARLPIKPTPGNLLRSIVDAHPPYRRLVDEYMRNMAPVLDFVTTATGMSLEGYCKLQTEVGLSFSEVDMFLTTTGKKGDGFAGSTPFGYTMEDLEHFFRYLKATVNTRLLREGFQRKQAFIYGSTRFASEGCKATATDVQRKFSDSGVGVGFGTDTNPQLGWTPAAGEELTCKVALGPDLTDVRTGLPVMPLWVRFGSHRILKIDDAMRALNEFERHVTPKADYPEFVSYVLYRVPKLNRPLLPPGQISQMCRVRPGPASTFLFPASGVLTPAAAARWSGALPTWSVLFSPLPRLGGANSEQRYHSEHGSLRQYHSAQGLLRQPRRQLDVVPRHAGGRRKRYNATDRPLNAQRRSHRRGRQTGEEKLLHADEDQLPIDELFRFQ
jgi:hypothetical protein